MNANVPSAILNHRRALVVLVHLALWSASFLMAFLLRFDFHIPDFYRHITYLGWLGPLLLFRAVSHAHFGLFHGIWRYTGSRDLENLAKATVAASVVLALCIQFSGITGFPRSILVVESMLALLFAGGLRYSIRAFAQVASTIERADQRRVLIVGAGDSGEMLLREMLKTMRERYQAVGFVDDDSLKLGLQIHGVPVLGQIADVRQIIAQHAIEEVVIAIPSASGREMRRILDQCHVAGVGIRTLPSFEDLIGGRVTFNQIREVAIEDLLGRDPVQLDNTAISGVIRGEVVLVTGAGGSIGSELCRQVSRFGPRQLVLVEQAENALYHIHRELKPRFPAVDVVPVIADICDAGRVREIMQHYRPRLVLHAAAHKHVPMMEANPGEAVKNNVGGTRVAAEAAHEAGVKRFVMISTDKAVNPTSVMGCSKRVAELFVQAIAQRSKTTFVTVRFGNVLGSNGSVVPLFKEQIARGGPVTVTHPEMVRYFMTIPEASQLVLQAGAMGRSGEIYILDMGEPIRILTLAEDLITLSGLKPYEDVEIVFTGIRPGEKLFEELSVTEENAVKTRHPKIYVGRSQVRPWSVLEDHIEALVHQAQRGDANQIRTMLSSVVPEYRCTPDHADYREDGSARGAVIPLEQAREQKSG